MSAVESNHVQLNLNRTFEDKDQEEYFRLLLTCSIACDIVYDEKPIESLTQKYSCYNHGIKEVLVSGCCEDTDPNSRVDLDVKYLICKDDDRKLIVVAFRGTHSMQDILIDVTCTASIHDQQGLCHSGFFKRASLIPLDYLLHKATEGYKIVCCGHSLGGSVAAIVTARLLCDNRLDDSCKPFHCIAFAAPLLADANFKRFIENGHWRNNFHFYVLEDDPVPVVLSLLSDLLHHNDKVKSSQQFTNSCLEFVKGVIDNIASPQITSLLSVSKITSKVASLAKLGVPRYTPFGNHIHMMYETTSTTIVGPNGGEPIEVCEKVLTFSENSDSVIYKKDLSHFTGTHSHDHIASVQKHRMSQYFSVLKKMFSVYYPGHAVSNGFFQGWFRRNTILSFQETQRLKLPEKLSPGDYTKKEDAYQIEIVANDEVCDMFLSFSCHSVQFLLSAKVVIGPNTYEASLQERNNEYAKCLFRIPNRELIRNEIPIMSELEFQVYSHFNIVKWKLSLPKKVEEGLSQKQRYIANLPVDQVLLNALIFVQLIKDSKGRKCTLPPSLDESYQQLISQFKIIDDNTPSSDFKPSSQKDLISSLRGMLQEVSYDPNELANKYSFSSTPMKLAAIEKTIMTGDKILVDYLHTVLSVKTQLAESFAIDKKSVQLAGVIAMGVIGVASAVAFPLGALAYALGALSLTASGVGLFKVIQKVRLSRQQDIDYKNNLHRFMDSLNVSHESLLPYTQYYEKALSSRCANLLWVKSQDEILDNWDKYFTTGYMSHIVESDQIKALRALRIICCLAHIRSILEKFNFIGVVGLQNCGKSSFIESVLLENANASGQVTTEHITPFPITDDIVFVDYPHFDCNNLEQKSLIVLSQCLMSHVFVIYDSTHRGDNQPTLDHYDYIKKSNRHHTIILNKADELFRTKERGVYSSNEDLEQFLDQTVLKLDGTKQRFKLAVLDTKNLTREEIGIMDKTIIMRARHLRELVIEIARDCCLSPHLDEREEQLEQLKEKIAELDRKEMLKTVQSKTEITIKKKNGRSKISFGVDEIRQRTFESLLVEIGEEFFDGSNVQLYDETMSELIESSEQLLCHESVMFVATK